MRFAFALLAFAVGSALAQVPQGQYKLDFVVRETGGPEQTVPKTYSTLVGISKDTNRCSIRSGSKMPMPNASGPNTQFTFVDVGTNIECSGLAETPSGLQMYVTADLTSAYRDANAPAPVIRQNRWVTTALVPLRKSIVLFSADDPVSKRQVTIEVTATPAPAPADRGR